LFFGHLTDENTHLDKSRDGYEPEAEPGAWPLTYNTIRPCEGIGT